MTKNDPFSQLAARTPLPRDSVLTSIQKELHQDPTSYRSLSRGARVGLSAGALVLGLVFTSVNAIFSNPGALAIAAAGLSLSFVGLLLAGTVPMAEHRLGIGGRRTIVLALGLFLFVALALHADSYLSMAQFLDDDSVRRATKCASHALLSGVVGAACLMFLWRRTDPFSPGVSGAFFGLAGGIMGALSVEILCAHREGLHLIVGHGASALILTGACMLLGRKWLSP